jgi:hypothetical protein
MKTTATNAEPAKFIWGFELQVVCATTGFTSRGPEAGSTTTPVPSYALTAQLGRGSLARPDIGINAVRRANTRFPGLEDVLADGAYTCGRPFLYAMRDLGLRSVFKPTKVQRTTRKTISVTARNRTRTTVIYHNGGFFHPAMPTKFFDLAPVPQVDHDDPDNLPQRLHAQTEHNTRAKYRYGFHDADHNGIRLRCPYCAGYIAIPGKPAKNRKNVNTVQPAPLPAHMDTCCNNPNGIITIPWSQVPADYQRTPVGTTTWCASVGRRNTIEGFFGTAKNRFHLDKKGFFAVSGRASIEFLLGLAAVVMNVIKATKAFDLEAADAGPDFNPDPWADTTEPHVPINQIDQIEPADTA